MRTSADHAEYDYHAGAPDEMVQAEQIAAELERLEREIGRAYIHSQALSRIADAMFDVLSRYDIETDDTDAEAVEMVVDMVDAEKATMRKGYARYRELHAEGATGEQIP